MSESEPQDDVTVPTDKEDTTLEVETEFPGAGDTTVSGEQKVAIVTGANSGVGFLASEKLAQDGYEVILACRSEEKAQEAIRQIRKKFPEAKLMFMKLDLCSLQSVREFADAFRASEKPLHVLCNNAGLTTGFSVKERKLTEDSFEMHFGVNHLGHFLLTNLLMEELRKTADRCGEVRIVSTSSMLHDPENPAGRRGKPAHLDFDNLMMDKPNTYDGETAYRNSKLANCLFSVELARRLEGANITSNTICPGFIPSTGIMRNETLGMRIKMAIVVPLLNLFGATRTVEHGGGILHDVATSPKWKGISGKHFSDFKESLSSKESRDPEVGKKLWDVSADLVKCEQAKDL